MRILIHLFLALALASLAGIFNVNLASATEKKEESDLDRGLVECAVEEGKIMCLCKQGTQACTDMIKNTCRESGAVCRAGYCSCEAKDSFRRTNASLRPKSVESGAVIEITPTNSSGNAVKPGPTKPDNRILRVRQLQQKVNKPTNYKTKSNLPRLNRSTAPQGNLPEIVARPLTASECTALGGNVGTHVDPDSKCNKAGQETCQTITATLVNNEMVLTSNYACIDE